MIEPKRYTAMTVESSADPFTGKRSREVRGYYYKHEGPLYAFNEGQPDQTKHYIINTGFADWNLERPMDKYEIQIDTLREIDDD